MQLKGRHWVVLWLGVFLVVAAAVVTRQTAAIQMARQLAELKRRERELFAEQLELIREIDAASSRQVLVPKAAALGLHLPVAGTESRMFRLRTTPREAR